ncbi:pantoate--beta-alanine ligase [Nafulsella turpanensis]|uniref:pantoate--beta-alanine ligase n=1 Tax=Nafulsella turpanensis TaxID=1265690 RepID=UPI0003481CAB|nr:pantoate--beta-alanine ligase [Nafulsella turpanensis]
MLVFDKKAELTEYLTQQRQTGKLIGFVPTMGALHQGHLSLIEASLSQTDLTVCSIFVNPTQFNNPQDLEKYPRTLEKDRELLEKAGCQVLFCPGQQEMYPNVSYTNFSFGLLETVMEGYFRPGHFHGVGLVVSKLFHIVQPNLAFFGQKDLQQCRIIEQLAKDLFFNVSVVVVPTMREADGLAMSSRNVRLQPGERKEAAILYKVLQESANRLLAGEGVQEIKKAAERTLTNTTTGVRLEYFCIADGGTLQPVKDVQQHKQLALCVAGYVGEVRLIDNLLLEL